MGMLASAGIGILVLAVVLPRPDFKKEPLSFLKSLLGANMLAPVIGGQMETAMPALSSRVHQKICNTLEANGASSNWNATYRGRLIARGRPGSKQHRTEDTLRVKTTHEGSQSFKGPDVWEQLSPFLIDSSKSKKNGFTGWIGRAGDSRSHHYLRASRSFFDVSEGHDGPLGIAKDHPPEDPGKGPPSFHHEPWCFG